MTPRQTRLLCAIDSKDFGNVAECLHEHGPVVFPGLRFSLAPNGRVLIEYDPKNPHAGDIAELDFIFCESWARMLRRSLSGESVRVPATPRFQLIPIGR